MGIACLLAVTFSACDPIYTAMLHVHRPSAMRGVQADSLVNGIAQRSGFSRDPDPDAMRFKRSWGTHDDWDDHPGQMWIVVERPADSLWQVSISEWLRTTQSPFGARLQRTIDSTLSKAGYVVTMP